MLPNDLMQGVLIDHIMGAGIFSLLVSCIIAEECHMRVTGGVSHIPPAASSAGTTLHLLK